MTRDLPELWTSVGRQFDNSGAPPVCVAEEKDGHMQVHVASVFESLPERPLSRAITLPELPPVLNSFPPETIGALRAMNRAFAGMVLEVQNISLHALRECIDSRR